MTFMLCYHRYADYFAILPWQHYSNAVEAVYRHCTYKAATCLEQPASPGPEVHPMPAVCLVVSCFLSELHDA